jgi:pimeloyl-ACP methyl ester carboxylesterase
MLALTDRHPARTLWLRAAAGNFSGDWCRTLAARMQACELRDLDAGHLVVMEQPELVASEVLRFARAA